MGGGEMFEHWNAFIWQKTASPQGRCELAHCLDAESMISSSTIPEFSSSLVLRAWSGPPSSTFD
jgi:hypothetical protein